MLHFAKAPEYNGERYPAERWARFGSLPICPHCDSANVWQSQSRGRSAYFWICVACEAESEISHDGRL